MTLLVAFSTTFLLAASILVARRLKARGDREKEQSLLRSSARIWGVEYDGSESEEELARRIRQARAEGETGDPVQTAARALRARRQSQSRRRSL